MAYILKPDLCGKNLEQEELEEIRLNTGNLYSKKVQKGRHFRKSNPNQTLHINPISSKCILNDK